MIGHEGQIFPDLVLVIRVLIAFAWGWGIGSWIHLNRTGKILEREYTWLVAVVGFGVDLAIAYPADWWTVALIVAVSSVGVIALALIYGYDKSDPAFTSYKLKWGLEDSIALAGDIAAALAGLLEAGDLPGPTVSKLSRVLAAVHGLSETLIATRRGDLPPKKSRGL